MARSILSLGMFSARAAMMAARSRAFIVGSGRPSLADTVISRASLPNSLDFTASCRPLRCMMFLNCECPAIASVSRLHRHCERSQAIQGRRAGTELLRRFASRNDDLIVLADAEIKIRARNYAQNAGTAGSRQPPNRTAETRCA